MLKHEKLSTGSESGFHKKMAAAARAGSGRSTDLEAQAGSSAGPGSTEALS